MTTVCKEGVVEFWFFRRDVIDVRVVGDFGAACDGGFPMMGSPDGWWHAKVALSAGEYRFRYVADGVWFTDYASNGIEVSKAGIDSVLVVPERSAQCGRTSAGKMVA